MSYLKIGSNSKLGKGIASFNIPAVITCPGRTQLCESVCYANKGLFKLQSKLHKGNYDITQDDKFVDIINNELGNPKIKAVRLHASGDFYSSEYIDKWYSIIKSNPKVKFWAYTRSYRIKDLVNSLEKLSSLSNLQLFASIDSETKAANESIPKWLRQADIVEHFDSRKEFVQCPNQKNKDITCEKCTYCFKDKGNIKQHVMFAIH